MISFNFFGKILNASINNSPPLIGSSLAAKIIFIFLLTSLIKIFLIKLSSIGYGIVAEC